MASVITKKALKYVSGRWGKEDEDPELDLHQTEDFFVSMMRKDDWILDDQTWNDLDMNRVYKKVNRTFSVAGQQCLYNMMRILRFDEEELKRRDHVVQFFQLNKDEREQIQAAMYYIGKDKFDGACSLLFKGTPELPSYVSWFLPMTIAMFVSLFLIPFLGIRAFFPALIFFIANVVLHNRFNVHTDATMPAVIYIGRMLRAAEVIAKRDDPQLREYNEFFRKCTAKCAGLKRKTRSMGVIANDPMGLAEIVNMVFLVQARGYVRCLHDIEENAPVLRVLYRRLGELDALQSVASYRRGQRTCTTPVFVEDMAYLEADTIVHPLLRDAVPNSITMQDRNVVITGSNMSGKSTFLRTIAINQITAQTIYTVSAKHYTSSFFQVLTSISPSDDLMEGTSYYMAEAEALLRMLHILNDERCSLLIIDEIFRGTNPTERVAAASSLLDYLADHNTMVIVATHDIEITQKVAGQYDSYHFTEHVTKDALEFDYKLHPGVLKSPNGIRILEYIGYPDEIIQEALADVGADQLQEEYAPSHNS